MIELQLLFLLSHIQYKQLTPFLTLFVHPFFLYFSLTKPSILLINPQRTNNSTMKSRNSNKKRRNNKNMFLQLLWQIFTMIFYQRIEMTKKKILEISGVFFFFKMILVNERQSLSSIAGYCFQVTSWKIVLLIQQPI